MERAPRLPPITSTTCRSAGRASSARPSSRVALSTSRGTGRPVTTWWGARRPSMGPIEGLRAPHHVVTGRPVPREVLSATREEGRAELALPADRQVVLVMGGSLGARSINEAAADAWAVADPGFTVIH